MINAVHMTSSKHNYSNDLQVSKKKFPKRERKKTLTECTGERPEQLRMLVLGHGGTGKSMLIGAITETFKVHGAEAKLAKCATSGVAAVIIGGQTFHSWAGIPITRPRKENWVDTENQTIQKRRKQNLWEAIPYMRRGIDVYETVKVQGVRDRHASEGS